MAKMKKQVVKTPASETVKDVMSETELPIIIDPAPIPAPPTIVLPESPALENPPEPANPFAYSDIKDIVRLPMGFQCLVKFECQDSYLTFLATADDVEPHGRAIYTACESGQLGDAPHYFPTDAELLEAVQERASRELRRANSEVTKYQDRVDIDDASDVDFAMLRVWKTYRVGLNRLPEQANYPNRITWPVAPDATAL
ncbi:tail fiber assembly protein [Collimonas fungivorans]|nr:tail fiber assembly protein [Collimonas fungivorans]